MQFSHTSTVCPTLISFAWCRLVLTSLTYHALSLALSFREVDSLTRRINATFQNSQELIPRKKNYYFTFHEKKKRTPIRRNKRIPAKICKCYTLRVIFCPTRTNMDTSEGDVFHQELAFRSIPFLLI